MSTVDLPLPQCQAWFDVIINDDVTKVQPLLELSANIGGEMNRMVNGQFRYRDMTSIPHLTTRQGAFRHPITIALSSGSLRVLGVLLQHGADLFQTEETGNYNLLHCLVCVAYYQPTRESHLSHIYHRLISTLTLEATRRLLHMENEHGFRPLKFVAS